jgi:hypothetical protein
MVADRLILAAWIVAYVAVILGAASIVFVVISNHRDRKRHDREVEHERLTDDIN